VQCICSRVYQINKVIKGMGVIMKYFELTLNSVIYKNAPSLINWYGIQDVRLIKWDSYHKLKNRNIYTIESSTETVFTDIISFPFLLVSSKVKDTIQMYGDKVVFKETILLDAKNQTDKVYYLPVMQENSKIKLAYAMKTKNSVCNKNVPEWVNERNIFWISEKGKRHTIINLDLAESLLRRKAIGLQLKEVHLTI